MLDFYHRLAVRLFKYRPVLWLVAGAAVAIFVGSLFFADGATDERYGLGSVTLLLWSLCLLMTTYLFAEPPAIGPEIGWLARLKARLGRVMLWLVSVLMTVLSASVVFLSIRAVGILT